MFSVLDFINSKDIRDYLESIEYKFTSKEAAWLVWQSRKSVREKHEAWNDIIETMPDYMIRKYRCSEKISLHYYLKQLIMKSLY